jgi:hypothetical protein
MYSYFEVYLYIVVQLKTRAFMLFMSRIGRDAQSMCFLLESIAHIAPAITVCAAVVAVASVDVLALVTVLPQQLRLLTLFCILCMRHYD